MASELEEKNKAWYSGLSTPFSTSVTIRRRPGSGRTPTSSTAHTSSQVAMNYSI
jgi:hypothetical protein